MQRKTLSILILVLLVVVVFSCKKDSPTPEGKRLPVLPDEEYDYTEIPNPAFFNPFGDSIVLDTTVVYLDINSSKATLGRVLFYDTQLSRNNRTSCGTCHRQIYAFSDNKALSDGFENLLTERNTQPIFNTGSRVGFFWDLRETFLDHMVLQPIANHLEMGIADQNYLIDKIENLEYYKPLFLKAFGSEEINIERVGKALAHFVRSIISISSKYDQGRFGTINSTFPNGQNLVPFDNFTAEENLGKQLFFQKLPCSTCHGGFNLDGSLTFAMNVGLEVDYKDNGAAGLTEEGEVRDGWFKTPSIRNIALTGPYMHDGRFQTLEEVIEFYDSGIQPHPQLSTTLRTPSDGGFFNLGPNIPAVIETAFQGRQPLRMFLSGEEKIALLAFLRTLTDNYVTSDPKFSDPFVIVN
jgi:cytochrome c peroxidase